MRNITDSMSSHMLGGKMTLVVFGCYPKTNTSEVKKNVFYPRENETLYKEVKNLKNKDQVQGVTFLLAGLES